MLLFNFFFIYPYEGGHDISVISNNRDWVDVENKHQMKYM